MKEIVVPLKLSFLVPDEGDASPLIARISALLLSHADVRTVHVGPVSTRVTREAICRVGSHPFTLSRYLPDERPDPDICSDHAYQAEIEEAVHEHQVMFAVLEHLTGSAGADLSDRRDDDDPSSSHSPPPPPTTNGPCLHRCTWA